MEGTLLDNGYFHCGDRSGRQDIHVEFYVPAISVTDLWWFVVCRLTIEDEALVSAIHDFVAFVNINWEAADIWHENTWSSRDVCAHIPRTAGRPERDCCDLVDMLDPCVLVTLARFDRSRTDITHMRHTIDHLISVLFYRLDHVGENRRATGSSNHEKVREALC